jgi:hypothetical protein
LGCTGARARAVDRAGMRCDFYLTVLMLDREEVKIVH